MAFMLLYVVGANCIRLSDVFLNESDIFCALEVKIIAKQKKQIEFVRIFFILISLARIIFLRLNMIVVRIIEGLRNLIFFVLKQVFYGWIVKLHNHLFLKILLFY